MNDGDGQTAGTPRRTFLAADVAAIASAIAVGLAVLLTVKQLERDERILTLQTIEQFEASQIRLGNPFYCIQFLEAIKDGTVVQALMSNEVKQSVLVELDNTGQMYLLLCLNGLEVRTTVPAEAADKKIKWGVVSNDEDGGPVELGFLVVTKIRNFVIDLLNVHYGLVQASELEITDTDVMNKYVEEQVYQAEPFINLVKILCRQGKKNLRFHYMEMINGINRRRDDKICCIDPNNGTDQCESGRLSSWQERKRSRHGK